MCVAVAQTGCPWLGRILRYEREQDLHGGHEPFRTWVHVRVVRQGNPRFQRELFDLPPEPTPLEHKVGVREFPREVPVRFIREYLEHGFSWNHDSPIELKRGRRYHTAIRSVDIPILDQEACILGYAKIHTTHRVGDPLGRRE